MKEVKSNPFEVAAACGAEALEEMERKGRQLLADNGYSEVLREDYDTAMQEDVGQKMSERGEELGCHSKWDADLGQYVIWWSFWREGKLIATSSALRLQGRPLEVSGNAEG